MDPSKTLLKIPWTHGSRQGFDSAKDSLLFRSWAMHSKRHNKHQEHDPKRWKANFRCAMNSLPDVEEVQSMTNKKGVNAYRVYRFLDEKPRKSTQKNKPGANTKAAKRNRANHEKAKRLQVHITEQKQRQIGVRRVSLTSPLTKAVTKPVTKPVTTPILAKPAALPPSLSIRPNSQLLKRTTSTSSAIPTTLSFVSPSQYHHSERSSPISGSPPPAELSRATDNKGCGSKTDLSESLSPVLSIPTFVEGECEEFGTTFISSDILSEDLQDENLSGIEDSEVGWAAMNVTGEEETNPKVTVHPQNRCSSPTLSYLNGTPDQEVMEMDIQELEEEADLHNNPMREIQYDQL